MSDDWLSETDEVGEEIAWQAFAGLAAIAAGFAARKAAMMMWSRLSSSDAPTDPLSDDTTWPSAIGWSVMAGALAGLARVVGRRGAAAAWTRMRGSTAPPVDRSRT